MKITKLAVLAALSLGLIACGGDDAPAAPTTGALSISITDAPITGATAVVVEFSGIELQGPGGRTNIDFDTVKSINLLDYQGSLSTPLAEKSDMPAGNYQWMRLKINAIQNTIDSYIEFENGMEQYSLYVPSGAESGLKLNRPFVIAAGGRTDFTIDFDLAKSIHLPSNAGADYKLRPTLRIVDNNEVGTVTGTVSNDILTSDQCTSDSESLVPAVYLFDGTATTLDDSNVIDDLDLNEPEPVTLALVNPDTGDYEIGFIQATQIDEATQTRVSLPYTVTLTCTYNRDDDEVDNSAATPQENPEVLFIDFQTFSLTNNEIRILDF